MLNIGHVQIRRILQFFCFFSVKRVHNEITSSFVELLHFFARNEYFFNKLRFPDPNLKALGVFELTLWPDCSDTVYSFQKEILILFHFCYNTPNFFRGWCMLTPCNVTKQKTIKIGQHLVPQGWTRLHVVGFNCTRLLRREKSLSFYFAVQSVFQPTLTRGLIGGFWMKLMLQMLKSLMIMHDYLWVWRPWLTSKQSRRLSVYSIYSNSSISLIHSWIHHLWLLAMITTRTLMYIARFYDFTLKLFNRAGCPFSWIHAVFILI